MRFVVPEPEPVGARVRFFTRNGGVSQPPFDTLNVSVKVGDRQSSVEENLRLIKRALGQNSLAWSRQVAGEEVVRVDRAGFAGRADALMTDRNHLPLVIAVADCVPVALVGGSGVGMVHSGWRGTISGITGKTAREMNGGVRAYIGPCIRGCCYEVSGELLDEFADRFGSEVISGRNLSLPAAIEADLREQGVEDIYDLGLCTGCRPDLFFSHRKQGPRTGRNLATVMKVS